MINLGYQYKNSRFVNFSVDLYYKRIEHLVNFSEKANVLFYNDPIEKKIKKWKTLFSYTLSWSWRQFDSVQHGEKQPYRYDRRHNLNWLFSYQPDATFALSLLWHFHTGDWITIPANIPSNPDEGMNNTNPGSGAAFTSYRGNGFNRVNLNATCYFKPWKKINQRLNAGVHIMDHPSAEYTSRFSTQDNKDYAIDLYPNQLFTYSWYISYNISF